MGRNTIELAEDGRNMHLPVAASTAIKEGVLVALNADGYAVPASKALNLKIIGRAENDADNLSGANGEIYVNVRRGVFAWDNDSTAANKVKTLNVMDVCYVKDECTVTMNVTGSSPAGRVIAILEDGTVAVENGLSQMTVTSA